MLQTRSGPRPGGEMTITGLHIGPGCRLQYEALNPAGKPRRASGKSETTKVTLAD